MIINTILEQKKMTKYRLSRISNVPQTTILDICSGKTKLGNCSSVTLYRLAKALDVSMESLIASSVETRPDFEIYKSHVCHKVKNLGDMDFIINVLESNEIQKLYHQQWYMESLYLLAMVDYISRENDLPSCTNYNSLRKIRLKETIYPISVHAKCIACGSDYPKQDSIRVAIPEFIRHNIVEADVRNVY